MSNQRAVAIAVLVVITIIVFGFFSYSFLNKSASLSRSEESVVKATFSDQQLVENLKLVQGLVAQYYQKTGYLPSVAGHLTLVKQDIPFDPPTSNQDQTIAGVHYVNQDDYFELCTRFATSNVGAVSESEANWEHGAGEVCFERDIRKILSPTPSIQSNSMPTTNKLEADDAPASLPSFWKSYSMCQPTSFRHTLQEKDNNLARVFGEEVQRVYWMRVVGTDQEDNSHCLVMMGYEVSEQNSMKMSGEAECHINKVELRGEDETMSTTIDNLDKFDQNDVLDKKLLIDVANGIAEGTLSTEKLNQNEKNELLDYRTRYMAQTPPRMLSSGKEGYCISKD